MVNQLSRIIIVGAMTLFAYAVVLSPGATLLAAPMKVAVVDPQVVLEKTKSGKRALADLKKYADARRKILTSDEAELKKLDEELKTATDLNEQQQREKQERFAQKVQAYQRRAQEFNQELAAKQKELVNEYMKKIGVATRTVAEKKGVALVVDKGSQNTIQIVIYNNKSIDLTDLVVREFDRRYK